MIHIIPRLGGAKAGEAASTVQVGEGFVFHIANSYQEQEVCSNP